MKFLNDLKSNKLLCIMAIPGIVWFVLFSYMPMFGLIIAFKDFRYSEGILGSKLIGFKNFEFLFKTSDAFIITRNTVLYNVTSIFLTMVLAVILAIVFDSLGKSKLSRFNQTVILMPHFLSWVVISYFVYAILSEDKGVANKVITMLGGSPVRWYATPKYWPFVLILCDIWKKVGYSCIIYYSTVKGFSTEYYEAAKIDGATWFQQIYYITLPLLNSIIILMLLINLGSIMYSDFGLFYLVTRNSGLLYSVTSTIDTYVYNGMMSLGKMGVTSAVAFYQSVIGFALVLTANGIVRKISREDALF